MAAIDVAIRHVNECMGRGDRGRGPGSLQARANEIAAKSRAQFSAGVSGFLVWAWSNAPLPGSYDVGPRDPLLSMKW